MSFASGNSDDEIGKWLGRWWEENSGNKLYGPYSAIGYHDDLKLKGVAIFTDYTGSNIEIHLHAPNCINTASLKYLFNYVFNELKCNVLRVKPKKSNKKIRSLLVRIGFVYECTLDDYYGPTEDDYALVYKFRRNWARKYIKLVDIEDAVRPKDTETGCAGASSQYTTAV